MIFHYLLDKDGSFRIHFIEVIGEGQNGIVYLIQTKNQIKVIKFYKNYDDKVVQQDFNILDSLKQDNLNPQLIKILIDDSSDSGGDGGNSGGENKQILGVMTNYIPGYTLAQLVETNLLAPKHLTLLNYLIEKLSIKKMVYPDLNPSNLMFDPQTLEWLVVDAQMPYSVGTFREAVIGNTKSIYSKLSDPQYLYFGYIKTFFMNLIGYGKYRIVDLTNEYYHALVDCLRQKITNW